MPVHFRSLFVVLLLAIPIFSIAKNATIFFSNEDFNRRRNLWLTLTLTIFISHNFWIYLIFSGLILLFTSSHERKKVALFFFILFAVPPISAEIPAFGFVNYLFVIDHIRFLEIVILLPALLDLRRQSSVLPFGKNVTDKIILAYLIWTSVPLLINTSFTDSLRTIFYVLIDTLLPYYVVSRSIKNFQDMREALYGLVVGASVLAIISVFELFKGWLLYSSLNDAVNVVWGAQQYLLRDGNIRAMASTGHSIVLGYVLVVALGSFFLCQRYLTTRLVKGLWLTLLATGLIAAQSRGPWLGAVVLCLVFVAIGPKAMTRIAGVLAGGMSVMLLLYVLPFGEKIIRYLPFIGSIDQENITYRQRLIEICIKLVMQNPIFGVQNFLVTPELQAMRQGQGIIDIVNTYVGVALAGGLVGLFFFVSIFAAVGLGIHKAMRLSRRTNEEMYLLGRVLLSVLIAILVIISTVSSILVIPVIYWAWAGLGVAYIEIVISDKKVDVKSKYEYGISTASGGRMLK